jgi:hypothetical protein
VEREAACAGHHGMAAYLIAGSYVACMDLVSTPPESDAGGRNVITLEGSLACLCSC